MEPARIDLTIYQGATFRKVLVWKSNDVAIDITSYTARMQIRENIDSTNPLIELTTENGRIDITGVEGKIELTIAATDTAALTFGDAVYDLELVNGSVVYRFCRGKVKLSREVTRD